MAKPGPKSEFPKLQDREWLAERIAAGVKGHDLAEEIGCSAPLLYKAVRTLGLTWPERTPARLRDADWLREQYIGKLRGTTDIAAEIGCSDTSVAAALKRLGIPARTQMEGRTVRSQRLRARVTMPEAREMYESGKTLVDLAEQYGVSEHVAKAVLMDAGVKIRTKAEAWRFMLADPEKVARRREAHAHRCRPTGLRETKKLLAQNAVCCWCQSDKQVEQHHLNGVRSDHRQENLVPLCRNCHAKAEWLIHHATEGLRRAYWGEQPDLRLPA